MRIAIDASALFGPSDGIGRYVSNLIPELIAQCGDGAHWQLLGRQLPRPEEARDWMNSPLLHWRADHLPPAVGRPMSLGTSQPWWLHRQVPDLYWAPAHRMSLSIPRTTARVLTVHDLCWHLAPDTMRPAVRLLDRHLMPRALMQADRVIAVSHSTAKDLLTWEPALEPKLSVVHEAALPMQPEEGIDSLSVLGIRSRYLLFVGGLEPRKNLARLIEAFAQLPIDCRSNTQLVIAGGHGWGGVDLDDLAQRFNVGGDVLAVGKVDDRCLATLYRFAECLAMPSLYEGFGLPVLESLSLGTPVLISGGGALSEVAGPAGHAVDPQSVEDITRGLTELLCDRDLRNRLAAQAIPWAKQFSWAKAARETWDVFQAALKQRQHLLARS